MARKANIINSLKMMGYSVGEDSDIYSIALRTGNNYMIVVSYTGYDLENIDFIVEEIVGRINALIVKEF